MRGPGQSQQPDDGVDQLSGGVADRQRGARGSGLSALDLTLDQAHEARLTSASAPHLNFPAENNGAMARIARNGGTTVDGVPTPAPPRLFQGTHIY